MSPTTVTHEVSLAGSPSKLLQKEDMAIKMKGFVVFEGCLCLKAQCRVFGSFQLLCCGSERRIRLQSDLSYLHTSNSRK